MTHFEAVFPLINRGQAGKYSVTFANHGKPVTVRRPDGDVSEAPDFVYDRF